MVIKNLKINKKRSKVFYRIGFNNLLLVIRKINCSNSLYLSLLIKKIQMKKNAHWWIN